MSVGVIEERLEIARSIPLSTGAHDDPQGDMAACKWCAVEKLLFELGAPWGDRNPDHLSEALAAFMRSYQDRTNDTGRAVIDSWIVEKDNALRAHATARDGHDEERRWILVDWSARTVAPAWLDAAGRTDSAAALRAHTPVTDRAGADNVLDLLRDARGELPDWWAWREKVRVTAREVAVKWVREHPGALKKAGVAGVAEAAEVAGAAGVAGVAFWREFRRGYRRGYEREWSKRFAHVLEPIQATVPALLDRLVTVGESSES